MKIKPIFIALLLSSCVDINGQYCSSPSEYDKNTAQSYYNSFGVYKAEISDDEARKLFGCNYRSGDSIYTYSTFWGKKLILVHKKQAVTYVDVK